MRMLVLRLHLELVEALTIYALHITLRHKGIRVDLVDENERQRQELMQLRSELGQKTADKMQSEELLLSMQHLYRETLNKAHSRADGIVQEAKKLEGTTAFARVKPLEGFEGRYIGSLNKEDGPKGHKNLCKAIEDAALTYRKYTAGELVEETRTPGPFQKAELVIGSLLDKTRKKAAVR